RDADDLADVQVIIDNEDTVRHVHVPIDGCSTCRTLLLLAQISLQPPVSQTPCPPGSRLALEPV
ncbi:hypothetical protein ACJEJT_23995, partial [Escherichia coli]